jgi:pyruvate/2-oxoglutarate dehydrogenase complex dihydrolipoamide acyltransferase (E2) component
MTDILMPALSPTMEEGTLAKWLVKAGDTVSSGQVIAEIETDKATMEVEAVDEGVVDALLVEAGTEGVKVNAVIARLKGEGKSLPRPRPPILPLRGGGCRKAPEGAHPPPLGLKPPPPLRRPPHPMAEDRPPPPDSRRNPV